MRKTAMLALALLLAALSGCAQSVYNAYRDVGSLLVVQALGIDTAPGGGVTLSCATGADASDSEPVRLRCSAASLDEAMRELESLAGAGSLFFAGTGAIVLGEAAAGEAVRWLDALARSKELRLDTELYVLLAGRAEALIAGEDAPEDVFAALDSLANRQRTRGPSPVATCGGAARGLLENGAAAVTALRIEDGRALPAGFAVLTDEGMAARLEGEAALGAGFFLGGPGAECISLEDNISLELTGGGVSVSYGGGVKIEAEVSAAVIEAPSDIDLSDAEAWRAVELELAGAAQGWLEAAVEAVRESGADFLGLRRALETRYPGKTDEIRQLFANSMPEIEVSAEARLVNVREYAASPFGGERE